MQEKEIKWLKIKANHRLRKDPITKKKKKEKREVEEEGEVEEAEEDKRRKVSGINKKTIIRRIQMRRKEKIRRWRWKWRT